MHCNFYHNSFDILVIVGKQFTVVVFELFFGLAATQLLVFKTHKWHSSIRRCLTNIANRIKRDKGNFTELCSPSRNINVSFEVVLDIIYIHRII